MGNYKRICYDSEKGVFSTQIGGLHTQEVSPDQMVPVGSPIRVDIESWKLEDTINREYPDFSADGVVANAYSSKPFLYVKEIPVPFLVQFYLIE